MPTVSVIVPNYCHAPYLEQRIESILQQTFQDFELILLDDCSTDGSREILERYRNHPKVSGIFYNERNSGSPFKQWKKGLSKATGDYVWIAESDDFSSPCFLERCVRILDTRPDCSIVFTSSYIVDSHSRTIREEAPVKYPKHKQIRFGSRFFLYRFLCPRNTIYNAGMALVRRSALPAGDNYTQYRYCGESGPQCPQRVSFDLRPRVSHRPPGSESRSPQPVGLRPRSSLRQAASTPHPIDSHINPLHHVEIRLPDRRSRTFRRSRSLPGRTVR